MKIVPMAINEIALIVDKKNEHQFKLTIESFIKQFQYQSYFEETISPEMVIKIRPQIWEIPYSVNEYLKIL